MNNILQVWVISNQRDQVPTLRYNNQDDQVSNSVRGGKVLGDMKYLMRSVKRAAEPVGIWTVENWDIKRVNSFYTMLSGRFNVIINKIFGSLS